jgi:hypothetical protein
MGSTTRSVGHLRLVEWQTNASLWSQSDFAWEILRRRADYHAGPPPARRTIGAPAQKPVTLIECTPPTDRSWGLLFRRRPAS